MHPLPPISTLLRSPLSKTILAIAALIGLALLLLALTACDGKGGADAAASAQEEIAPAESSASSATATPSGRDESEDGQHDGGTAREGTPPGESSRARESSSARATKPLGPPGPSDVVVFIAKFRPFLYRLMGERVAPWGNARFVNPVSIVADRDARTFYVLDRPQLISDPFRIWRIAPDGRATVIHRAALGPRADALALDGEDSLLVIDRDMGLYRLEPDGGLRRVIEDRRPLHGMTAAVSEPSGTLIVGSSYTHETRGQKDLSTGGTLGPITDRYAGGVFRVDLARSTPSVELLIENREPGGTDIDTRWRGLRQILRDSHDRLILVDRGSKFEHEEMEFLGTPTRQWTTSERVVGERVYGSIGVGSGTYTEHIRKRKTESEIDGGILVVYPDGRVEDLTFKTPEERRGLLWQPHGAAEWADGMYLIADPRMYEEGMEGTGGLLLLGVGGSRSTEWRFGWRRQPVGVAILRADEPGQPLAGPVPPPRRLSDLEGNYASIGAFAIDTASWTKIVPREDPSPFAVPTPFRKQEIVQPAPLARARVQDLFQNASWRIGASGTLVVSLGGVDPSEDRPEVIRAELRLENHAMVFSGRNRPRTTTDPAFVHLEGALEPLPDGSIAAHADLAWIVGEDALYAVWDEKLAPAPGTVPKQGAPPNPVILHELVGSYRAGPLRGTSHCVATKTQLAGDPGSITYGLYRETVREAPAAAAAKLAALVRGSSWEITLDGRARVALSPIAPGASPTILEGRVWIEGAVAEIRGMRKPQGTLDSALGFLRGTVERERTRELRIRAVVSLSGSNESFEAEFELPVFRADL